MILSEVANKDWIGVKASRKGPAISHLFFADDLMLFGRASRDQMEVMMKCIEEFYRASGLKISVAKSRLFVSPNVDNAIARSLSTLSSIPLTNNLGTYLGVPIVHGR